MELSISRLELDVLRDFLSEAQDHLDGIEDRILQLESEADDPELINSIFRPAHTIKGSAAFLGLNDIKYLAHEMETLLDELRKGRITVSPELVDTLLAGVDILGQMLQDVSSNLEGADTNADPVIIPLPDLNFSDVIDVMHRLKSEASETSDDDADASARDQGGGEPHDEPVDLASIEYPDGMREQFIDESREHLESLEKNLVEFEKHDDRPSLVNDMFRALHSLKGNAGVILSTVTPEELQQRHPLVHFRDIAHAAESIMQGYRDTENVEIPDDVIEMLLQVVDTLKGMIDGFEDNHIDVQYGELLARLKGYVPGSGSGSAGEGETEKPEDVPETMDEAFLFAFRNSFVQSCEAIEAGLSEVTDDEKRSTALDKMKRAFQTLEKLGGKAGLDELVSAARDSLNIIEFLSGGKDENENLFLEEIADNLKQAKQRGEKICAMAESGDRAEAGPAEGKKQHDAAAAASAGQGPVKGNLKAAGASAQPASRPASPAAKSSGAKAGPSSQAFIKVSQEKLDKLMNLVGELIVSKNNFLPLARELSIDYSLPDIGKKVKAAGDMVSRISDELQATVMSIRMLPVSTVFARFPRMIRDLSRKMSKKINLVISGEETELDKTIIEALGDPMVHLIRNSADHGLEPPEERRNAGKPEEGTIELRAYNQGQNVIIDIIDDGRGIDANAIRMKALEKGIVSMDDIEKMDDRAVLNLIFMPGFSTAEKVTEVSGRGVGMDVVKTNIEKIGGSVQISSIKGAGTTVSIKLPLTLAVSKGLEIAAGGEHYFLPLDYVVETVRIDPSTIHRHRDERMVVVRDNLLPIRDLAEILDCTERNGSGTDEHEENGSEDISLVILNINGRRLALEVDRFFNESEFVIKSIEGAFAGITGLSGATVTGEGKVILVLDPVSLF